MGPVVRFTAILLGLALAGGTAFARPHDGLEPPAPSRPAPDEDRIAQQDFVPLEQVLDGIRDRYPGHQLSVSGPRQAGGGYVYEIKWLTDDGAVLYIVVDAESGAILSVEGG